MVVVFDTFRGRVVRWKDSCDTGSVHVSRFSPNVDPERQADIAFALIVLAILGIGGLTFWFFYGAR